MLHENVAAAQVNLVRVYVASHDQEAAGERTTAGDLETRDVPLEHGPARDGARKEIAESEPVPALTIAAEEAVVGPGRIVAHAGHTDEEIDVAHHFGERERRNIGERHRYGIASAIEPHLVRREVYVNAAVRNAASAREGRCREAC